MVDKNKEIDILRKKEIQTTLFQSGNSQTIFRVQSSIKYGSITRRPTGKVKRQRGNQLKRNTCTKMKNTSMAEAIQGI